jgi:hypothetical protein
VGPRPAEGAPPGPFGGSSTCESTTSKSLSMQSRWKTSSVTLRKTSRTCRCNRLSLHHRFAKMTSPRGQLDAEGNVVGEHNLKWYAHFTAYTTSGI